MREGEKIEEGRHNEGISCRGDATMVNEREKEGKREKP